MIGALTLPKITCPYCGLRIDRFDLELTGGHRECLSKREEEGNMLPDRYLDEPVCAVCRKKASELSEYRHAAGKRETPADYVRKNEGTYNSETNRFWCTECYCKIGMPSSPGGIKTP